MTDQPSKRRPGRPPREQNKKDFSFPEISSTEYVTYAVTTNVSILKIIMRMCKSINSSKVYFSFNTNGLIIYTSHNTEPMELYVNLENFFNFYVCKVPTSFYCITERGEKLISASTTKDSYAKLNIDVLGNFYIRYKSLQTDGETIALVNKTILLDSPWENFLTSIENLSSFPIIFTLQVRSIKRTVLQYAKQCDSVKIVCNVDVIQFHCHSRDSSGSHIAQYTDLNSTNYKLSEPTTFTIDSSKLLIFNSLPIQGELTFHWSPEFVVVVYNINKGIQIMVKFS